MASVRLITKQLLADAGTSPDFRRSAIFDSDKAFDSAKGNLTSDKGIGRDLVGRILKNMPGMTVNSIGASLERLKASGDYARNICCMIDENLTQQHIVPKTIFEIVAAAIKEAEKMLRATNNVYEFNAYFKRSRGLPTLLQKSVCPDPDRRNSWAPEEYTRAKLAIEPSGEGLGRGFLQHFLPPHSVASNSTLQAAIAAYYQEEWRKEGDRLTQESQVLLQEGKIAEAQELEKQARVLLGKVKQGGISRALLRSLSNNEKASDPEAAGKKRGTKMKTTIPL